MMKIKSHIVFRITFLTMALLGCQCVSAEELWFPSELVTGTGENIDLSHFERGEQLPGRYKVAVFINQQPQGIQDIDFIAADSAEKKNSAMDDTGLTACLMYPNIQGAELRPDILTKIQSNKTSCLSLAHTIPDASTSFDFDKMRLDISLPQSALLKRPRNWISPERWDDGITAGILNYAFSGTHREGVGGSINSEFLRVNSGFNLGDWRLRDARTLSIYSVPTWHSQQWHSERTWLEKGIHNWQSRLVMGDITTDTEFFDAVDLRGIQLMTDNNMFPDSQRGYAPVIRGTALTNAQVSIQQNGYRVYQTNVAPGEFAIDDLHPMHSNGDFFVTVTEADGAIHTFTVPYASLPTLQREGRVKYDFSMGILQEETPACVSQPVVLQGSLRYGATGGVTPYGGIQLSERYQSAVLGTGFNMGAWGAFSADITHAESKLSDGSEHDGQSLRFLYGRTFELSGTSFQLAGYRYSTEGFYTLQESYRSEMYGWRSEPMRDIRGEWIPRLDSDRYDLKNRRREKMELNISQRLGGDSSLRFSGSRQTYRNGQGNNTQLTAGFNSTLGPVRYALNYNENRGAWLNHTDRNMSMSFSLPLDALLSNRNTMSASFNSGKDRNGVFSQQASLSGSLLEKHNFYWNVAQGHSARSDNSSSVRLAYQGGYGNVSGGYSQGQMYRQVSYDASGGIIAHQNGVTFGQSLGDSSILIAAPHAVNVPLEGSSGVTTDWRGYAIQPNAMTYRENRVALDVTQLDNQTEIDEPVTTMVPTKGAIVRADFQTKSGYRALILLVKHGKKLPFGTQVEAGESNGLVDEEGQVYLSGINNSGDLTAHWGKTKDQSCQASWSLDNTASNSPLNVITAVCQ